MRRFDRSFLETKQTVNEARFIDDNAGKRWGAVYADHLHVFQCPSPRPAGVPDAEQRTSPPALKY